MILPNITQTITLLVIIIALAIIQLREYRRKSKLRKQLMENAPYYSLILANVIKEINLPGKDVISMEENDKLISVMEMIPQVTIVKKMLDMLKIYKVYVSQHPEIMEEKIALKKTYTLPLMYKFLELFSYLDKDMHEFINEKIEHYSREGKKFDEMIPSILSEVVERIINSSKPS